jgi:transporter family protein
MKLEGLRQEAAVMTKNASGSRIFIGSHLFVPYRPKEPTKLIRTYRLRQAAQPLPLSIRSAFDIIIHMSFPSWALLGLASGLFAALVAVFGKIGLDKMDPTLSSAMRGAFMFVTLSLVAVFTGKLSELHTLQGRPLFFIVLAGIAGGLSWLCYFWALRLCKAGHVASLDRLSIVFVVLLAAVFLGEKLTWKSGIGAVIMAIGAALIALA